MTSDIPIVNAHQSLLGRYGSLMASPVIIALLLIRMVLHGLIAWIVWQAGAHLWGAVAQVYGGLLPALVFSFLVFIFAWRTLRSLPRQANVTAQGIHLLDGRFISGTEIRTLAPVAPKAMVWHLLWPAMPWRLLTLPHSLQNWWRMEAADGVFFLCCGDVEVTTQLATTCQFPSQNRGPDSVARSQTAPTVPGKFQPFCIPSPWAFDVAICLIVLVERSLIMLLVLYGVGRIGWIARQYRRKMVWRRVAVRSDVEIHTGVRYSIAVNRELLDTICPSSEALSIGRSTRSVATPASRLAQKLWRFALLPLSLLSFLDHHRFSAAQLFAYVGHRFFSVLTWLLLSLPLLLIQQANRIPGSISRLAIALLRRLALVFLRPAPKVWRALTLAFSLWQTALLTLVGWAVAVLLSYPLAVLVSDPQAALWHEAWMVRGLLWRASDDESARQASAMLEKARAAGDKAAVSAVLQGAAVDGVFHLVGWQQERRQTMTCRDAVPQMAGIRLQLDEQMDTPALLREVACNLRPGHLQSELLADAYRRSGGKLDIHVAVSSGDPALLPLVLKKERLDGILEERDWQGRTPLLLALDLAAAGGERKPGWLSIAQLLQQRGADVLAVDNAGRSTAFLAVQSGLSGDALKPYLLAATAASTSALGATLEHAAAASGEVTTLIEVSRSQGYLDLDSRTRDGRNALHFARGAAMVQALFRLGLDPDSQDVRGRLPLHTAILSGDSSAALALAHITLAPQTMDNFGRTPLDYAPAVVNNAARKTGSNKPLTDAERPWNELARELAERTRK